MKILRTRLALTLGAVALTVSTAPAASALTVPIHPGGPGPFIHNVDMLQTGKGYYEYWDAIDFDNNTFPQVASAISAMNGELSQVPFAQASINPQVGAHADASAIVLPSSGGDGQAAMDAKAMFDASLSAGAFGNSVNIGYAPSIEAYASYARGGGTGTYRATVTGHDFTGAIHHYVDASTPDPISISESYFYYPPASLPTWSFNAGIGTITFANYLVGDLSGTATGALNVVGGGSVSVAGAGAAIYEGILSLNGSSFGVVVFTLLNGPSATGGDAHISASTNLLARAGMLGGSLCGSANAALDAEQIASYNVGVGGLGVSLSKYDTVGITVHPPDYAAQDCVNF
jgi:hypothetical protein